MDYVLIRDKSGDLCVMPDDVFDLACKDGTIHPDTEPLFCGDGESCLIEMESLKNEWE